MRHPVSLFITSLFTFLFCHTVVAENSTKIPGYTIHHNAVATSTLTPAIAHAYRIPRSRYRAMINISVLQDKEGTTGIPVKSRVSAQAKNIQGLIRDIQLFEIVEGNAVYYIGHFPIADKEELTFKILAQPFGEAKTHEMSFKNRFFVH